MCFGTSDEEYLERPRQLQGPKYKSSSSPFQPPPQGYFAPGGPRHPLEIPIDDTDEKVTGFMVRYQIPHLDGSSKLSSVFQWVSDTLLIKDNEIAVIKRSTREEVDRITSERYKILQDRDRFKALYERDSAALATCQEALYQANTENEDLRGTIAHMQWEHNATLVKNQDEYEKNMDDQDTKHQAVVKKLRLEIDDLKERIAEYTSQDSAVISDDAFRTSLLSLSQQLLKLIDYIPKPIQQQPDTKGWSRFIRSVCWTHLLHGFYQYPLGFGIFGVEGEAHRILSHFSEAIRLQLPGDANNLTMSNQQQVKVNEGRGFLFERILEDFLSDNRNSEKEFTIYFRQNIERVTQDLVRTLQQCCGQALDSQVNKRIWTVVRDAGVLALQMGSQRAHVMLVAHVRGDIVKLKHMFEDETGHFTEEVKVVVDQMTQPGLMRIGNGKEDSTREQVILKGKIIPLKTGD
ncbi:hypothetical protein QBC36DRAFT_61699 [Triangularia setosa]|uniref:Uncharacterized protein n=1 Tax=Triangularia setosa TaxID=2587417 RepID=A0AAN6W0G5_9PEZI|nr:hypothetical protein QBC36DRAFT_61699 [Podospora setosa]